MAGVPKVSQGGIVKVYKPESRPVRSSDNREYKEPGHTTQKSGQRRDRSQRRGICILGPLEKGTSRPGDREKTERPSDGMRVSQRSML